MKTLNEWFDEYSESHQNKTNKMIHWLCTHHPIFNHWHFGAFQCATYRSHCDPDPYFL